MRKFRLKVWDAKVICPICKKSIWDPTCDHDCCDIVSLIKKGRMIFDDTIDRVEMRKFKEYNIFFVFQDDRFVFKFHSCRYHFIWEITLLDGVSSS